MLRKSKPLTKGLICTKASPFYGRKNHSDGSFKKCFAITIFFRFQELRIKIHKRIAGRCLEVIPPLMIISRGQDGLLLTRVVGVLSAEGESELFSLSLQNPELCLQHPVPPLAF